VSTLLQNIRYAVRMFVKNPGFTAVAVLCLALGTGATTAIFSVVNAVLLRPLPYAQPARLLRVFTEFPTFPNGGLRHFWVSEPEYLDLKRDITAFDDMEAWSNRGVNLAGTADPVRATASFVTGGMFPLLGVAPVLGRPLSADDDRPGIPLNTVISFDLWQRAYGGDRSVLNRDIRLNGRVCTVVGVMPPGFAFPPGELDAPELWLPLQLDPAHPAYRGGHYLNVLGQLRQGYTLGQAQGEIAGYVKHSSETIAPANHPFDPKFHPIVMAGFQDEVVHTVRRAMLVLLGAVGFVLLIACVNVANLLLARSEARRKEIAVRAAIGAGTGRLLQQFVIEGIMLSLAGAGLGLLLALAGLRLLVKTNAGSIPRIAEISIDWQVLLFTLAVSVITGVAFGLAPIVHTRAAHLHDVLKTAAGRNTSSGAANRFRAVLVSSELALALVLLIGAGLMVKAFWKLQEVHAGVNPENVLTMRIALPGASYGDAPSMLNFWQSVTTRAAALPGVVSASVVNGLPPDRPINANDTPIEGFVPTPGGPIQNVDYWNFTSGHYAETMGIQLLEGRFLSDNDGPNAPLVVAVNQTMAKMYWPHESAIGHRVKVHIDNNEPRWSTIVGVVADVKNAGLDHATGTELYIPVGQSAGVRQAYLLLKTHGDPMLLAGAIRQQIREVDRALPVAQMRSLEDVMSSARARPRFLTLLLAMFSALSLILAALGIYGVISYAVTQRTNEIGIRMALGAQQGDVVRLIGSGGLKIALAGTAIGALGAWALTRFLSGMLFGVSSMDAVTFIAMTATLIGVTMVASYIPARRASRVDPLIALRYE
jgi:putative ABC transport system permease protein